MDSVATDTDLRREFERQGFVLIPNALAGAQIAQLNRAIDRFGSPSLTNG